MAQGSADVQLEVDRTLHHKAGDKQRSANSTHGGHAERQSGAPGDRCGLQQMKTTMLLCVLAGNCGMRHTDMRCC